MSHSSPSVALVPSVPSPASAPATWETVRYYADTAAKFQRCTLACHVMAGFALTELHKTNRPKRGPKVGGQDQTSWGEIVEDEAGISRITAWKWMEMAKACRPRLKKLDGTDRLKALLELHPSQWSQDDTHLLSEAVHKITDGKTQLEFMWELGVAKKPQGSGATGGAREHPPRPQMTPELEHAQMVQFAKTDWEHLRVGLMAYMEKFAFLSDHEINIQIAVLERCASLRLKWISTPPDARDPRALRNEIAEIWYGAKMVGQLMPEA